MKGHHCSFFTPFLPIFVIPLFKKIRLVFVHCFRKKAWQNRYWKTIEVDT